MKTRLLQLFKDFLVTLSLANLLFVFGRGSLAATQTNAYHESFGSVVALLNHSFIICILLTAIVFLIAYKIDRSLNKETSSIAAKLIFVGLAFAVVHEIRLYGITHSSFVLMIQNWIDQNIPRLIYLSFFALILIAAVLVERKWSGIIVRTARQLLLISSTFFLVTFYYYANEAIALSASRTIRSEMRAKTVLPEAVSSEGNSKNRVVWFIFDELDFHLPFESFAKEMPELNRFKETSFFAANANSPSHDTLESIPSLLTGKKVKSIRYMGGKDLNLKFLDDTSARFRDSAGLFSEAHEKGKKIGIIGTYHPYCRLFGRLLDYCIDYEAETNQEDNGLDLNDLFNLVRYHVRLSLTNFPGWFRFSGEFLDRDTGRYDPEKQKIKLEHGVATAKALASQRDFDLVYVHLLFPHEPFLYDRKSNTWNGAGSYLDNLVLVDRAFGEIQTAMESSGTWDNTTVIVSADHPWRLDANPIEPTNEAFPLTNGGKADPRVPFIVKMSGQTAPAVSDKNFNTVITTQLIRSIMNGEIANPDDLKKRIDVYSQ